MNEASTKCIYDIRTEPLLEVGEILHFDPPPLTFAFTDEHNAPLIHTYYDPVFVPIIIK
jgi:hypothetical protein